MKSIILDPKSQRTANSPLELLTGPWIGPGLYLTDHKYPDPEQEILSAGGREGKKRTGPPVLGNRQIPIEIFASGRREDYATAPVNYALNPKGELEVKFPIAGTDFTITRERETAAVPSYLGEYRDKHAFDGSLTEGAVSMGAKGIAFPSAGTWVASMFVWIPSSWDGSQPELDFTSFGSGSEVHVRPDLSIRDSWQRIYSYLTVAAGNLSGTLSLRVSGKNPSSAATGIVYSDCLQIEPGMVPTYYFDGDSPGSSWTGTAHASTSTQPAGADEHFEAMVNDLERKLMQFRDEGGTYSRPYRSGRLVFDVEGLVSGDEGEYEGRRWTQRGQKFSAVIDALPHGRGETKVGELASQTTDPVMIMSIPSVGGSVKALAELEVTDTNAIARRGFVGAIEVPEYDSTAETAALYYQAEKLTPMGASVLSAVPGATGTGNTTIETILEPAWKTIASTKIAASGKHLTHVGTFRIFARIRQSGFVEGGELQYRLEWGQGDLIERTTNDPGVIVAKEAENWYLVDLGLVRIEQAKAGAQRWEGQIIARSYDPAGSNYKPKSNIDDLRIVPVKDAYVRARSPETKLDSPTSFTNLDGFNQTPEGPLNGKSADTGGVWATVNGDGSGVTDFTVNSANKQLIRAAAGTRIGVLPTVIAGSVMHTVWHWLVGSSPGVQFRSGTVLRYIDSANFLALIHEGTTAGTVKVSLAKWVAGVRTTLATKVIGTGLYSGGLRIMSVFVGASGRCLCFNDQAAFGATLGPPIFDVYDAALASGGSLASGKVGVYNYANEAKASTLWDYLQTWIPAESTLIASGRKLRWNHLGVQREDAAGGDQWSEVGYEGDPLLLPPSTKEGRAARGIFFPTRGDLETLPDSGNSDDFSARLTVTSRHVSVR